MSVAMEQAMFDCRDAFASTLVELARADERVVAVVNDSVGSTKLGDVPRRVPGSGDQRRHRRAEHGRRRCGPGQRRAHPLRVRRVVLPHRTGAGADQGRRRLLAGQRQVRRRQQRHGLRRARPDAPLDRGHGVAARRSPTSTSSSRPIRRRPARSSVPPTSTSGRCSSAPAARPCRPCTPADYRFEFGRAAQLRDGDQATVITNGTLVAPALVAAEALGDDGIEVRVLNMASVSPPDTAAVVAAARETGAIVTRRGALDAGRSRRARGRDRRE